ncbi:MAG: helix-turn-helix domain-containing protein [Hyphomicrobiaceae bacterium]
MRASSTEQRYVRRAGIVLLAADGMASRAIAREVGVMTGIVSVWRKRFAAAGIDGLKDKPRPGNRFRRPRWRKRSSSHCSWPARIR